MSAPSPSRPSAPLVPLLLAFAAVYVIWGSTYLAIGVVVRSLPPLVTAGARFLCAGVILYAIAKLRGAERPTRTHWRSAFIVGGLLLFGGNGLVCWAEQYVETGATALFIATTPLWMVVLDWTLLGGPRPTRRTLVGVLLGLVGVSVLADVDAAQSVETLWGYAALLLAACAWASGSLYARHAPFPKSTLLPTAMEMIAGGVLLLVVGTARGEISEIALDRVPPEALLALGYLVVFGSLVAFSAYVWLLKAASPAAVSTYAFVNPVVAILLGWAILDEPMTVRTLAAAALIVVAVAFLSASKRVPPPTTAAASTHARRWFRRKRPAASAL